jgi:tetratricopeptide (TPR) repeat protein
MHRCFLCLVLLAFSIPAWAQAPPRSDDSSSASPRQQQEQPQQLPSAPDEQSGTKARPGVAPVNRVPASPNDSSSRKEIIDLSPPTGDIQEHPESQAAEENVNEMRPWDPHRASKDIEVGDYYFKQKNYRGAEMRYRDALFYKPNDAISTFRLAEIFERTGRISEALQFYSDYLKILPHGPYAHDAQNAISKLQAELNPPK